MSENEKLLPCPFCGEQPTTDGMQGTQIEFSCCVSMSLQKSDVLTLEERGTWRGPPNFCYSVEAEAKCLRELTKRWNRRALAQQAAPWVCEEVAKLEAALEAERAKTARLVEALEAAAKSLRTISELAGRGDCMIYMQQVRGYANSRAGVAEAALAEARK